MKEIPLISIIVPVFNVEKYLSKCIESILNQSLKEIEIILVNDGSTDKSGIICNKYSEIDNRIVVIHQENKGVSFARKRGLDISHCDYIMFIDADDWLDIETCKITYNIIIEKKADVVFFSYVREYKKNSIPVQIFKENLSFVNNGNNFLQRRVVGLIGEELRFPHQFDSLTSMYMRLIKKEVIINNNIEFIDTKYIFPGEDTIFNIQLFQFAKRVEYINTPFYHYRREVITSATSTFNSDYFEKWLKHLLVIKDYIRENNLGKDYEEALNNRICCEFIGISIKESNPLNPRSFLERLKFLKMVLTHEMYIGPFKKLDLTFMPIHWKLFFKFCKMKSSLGVYLMSKGIRFMKSRI